MFGDHSINCIKKTIQTDICSSEGYLQLTNNITVVRFFMKLLFLVHFVFGYKSKVSEVWSVCLSSNELHTTGPLCVIQTTLYIFWRSSWQNPQTVKLGMINKLFFFTESWWTTSRQPSTKYCGSNYLNWETFHFCLMIC